MGMFDFLSKTKTPGRVKQRSTKTETLRRTSAKLDSRHTHSKIEERRNEYRHPTYLSTIVKQNNQDTFGTIINFSESGFGILLGKEFKEHDILDMTLSMNNEAPLNVRLNIQSCRQVDGEYFIGARIEGYCPLHNDFFKSMTRKVQTANAV